MPKIYGLPKTHKTGISLQPVISWVGSVPNNITNSLTKMLSLLLGMISKSHIKNSGDLLNKIYNLNMGKQNSS